MQFTVNATKTATLNAKRAFSTRRVPQSEYFGLSTDFASTVAGDLLLARVIKIGQHKKLQLTEARYSELHLDDTVLVCVGDRYAPDQFEGHAKINCTECDLIAAGGIAGKIVHAHSKMAAPTQLEPMGLVTDNHGDVVNIASYALPCRRVPEYVTVIGVFGTSMNSGKTTTAASIAHGLIKAGRKVAGIKATGTGAFGDFNAFRDAGVPMLDFVDAGMPTTYRMPLGRIETGFDTLVGHAADRGATIVIVEFADGVLQGETHKILKDSTIRNRLDGLVLASGDAAGAVGSISILRAMDHKPLFISGLVSCSPLASREAADVTNLPVFTRKDLHTPELMESVLASVFRNPAIAVESAA